ncbi:MAG: hypothetical protein O2967_23140, partial [Proteobacteria bacterium]|nr:hypothetical protein [Pseudomonadota bacterium]
GSTPENGPTLHLVGVGNNRIGKEESIVSKQEKRFIYVSDVNDAEMLSAKSTCNEAVRPPS